MGCGGGERTILSLSAEDVWTVLEEEIRFTVFHRPAGYFLSVEVIVNSCTMFSWIKKNTYCF